MDCSGTSPGSRSPDIALVLATLPPTPAQARLTWLVMAAATLAFMATIPFARVPLPALPAFLLVAQTVLILCDLITVIKLLAQFEILQWRALLALANGYLFSACMAVLHVASFPGIVALNVLPGDGSQTTAWLYFFWHGGFPLFIIAYAVLARRESGRSAAPAALRRAGGIGVLSALWPGFGLACGIGLLAFAGDQALPAIMQGDTDASGKILVAVVTWSLIFAAMTVLWRKNPRSLLDLALLVVLLGWAFDVGLAAVFNHGRYDLGWYAGRAYGTITATFVLAVLLIETTRLYSRLAEAHLRERQAHDLAERRADELKALNKELEAFSYSVSHDLRAPLRAITGFAGMIEEDCAAQLDQEGKRWLGVVRDEAARMGTLIDDLLEFARLGRKPLALKRVDMTALAREVAQRLLRDVDGVPPTLEIAELPAVQGDRALLERVWVNLIGNAVKFSSASAGPTIRINGRIDGNEILYEVEDNGAGFDMHYVSKLFGVFQRLHTQGEFPGTGVGLAIVQRVVNRHGGRVWANGRPGEGASFGFALPGSGQS